MTIITNHQTHNILGVLKLEGNILPVWNVKNRKNEKWENICHFMGPIQ